MTTIIGVRIDGRAVAFDRVSSTIGIRHGRSTVDDGPLASSAALELVNITKPIAVPSLVANGDFSDGLNGWGHYAGTTLELESGAGRMTRLEAGDQGVWANGNHYHAAAGEPLEFRVRVNAPLGQSFYGWLGWYTDAAWFGGVSFPFEGAGKWQAYRGLVVPPAGTVRCDWGLYWLPELEGAPLGSSLLFDDAEVGAPGEPFPVNSFRVGVTLELDSPDGPAFRGRLSDAALDAASNTLSLTAIGELAAVTRRPCGRYGFPAQLWADRVRQAFSEAGALDRLELELGAWNPPLAAVEPDEAGTLGTVLGELVNDTGAAIADTPDGRVLVQTIDARAPASPVASFSVLAADWICDAGCTVADDPSGPFTVLGSVAGLGSGVGYWLPGWAYRPFSVPMVKGETYRLTFGNNSFVPEFYPRVSIHSNDWLGVVHISVPQNAAAVDFVATWDGDGFLDIYHDSIMPVGGEIRLAPMVLERLGVNAFPMVLPPETVLYAPDWTMVDDVANVLELEWALGKVTTRDETSVRRFEPRPASLSTRLSDYSDAQRRSSEFLTRRSNPDWVVSEATVLARVPVSVGLAASLSMLPPSSPAESYVGVIEGWADSIADDEWTTTLALSAPRLSGLGLRWRDPIAQWDEAGPATWHDPSSLDPSSRSPILTSRAAIAPDTYLRMERDA